MRRLRCAAIGRGALLVRCAETLLERGHELLLVVSEDASPRAWAVSRGVETSPAAAALESLAPLDLLLSVQNDALLPEAALASSARAVNVHDAPLPRYAGFHAPTWALLAREPSHGVTWHEMTARADAGDVLVQKTFALAPDETAFTLSGKCFEAAVAGLAELLDSLASASLTPRPQDLAARTAFSRARRPAREAVVSFSRPAEEVDALARALDFGPSPNPLALPKVWSPAGGGFVAFRGLSVLQDRSGEAPGTVLASRDGALRVATASLDVELRSLVPLGHARIPRAGERLDDLDADLATKLAAFDRRVAPSEAFFAERLAALSPARLPYGAPARNAPAGELSRIPFGTPASFRGLAARLGVSEDAALAAAFGSLLARLGGAAAVDLALPADVPADLTSLYAPAVPLRVDAGAGAVAEVAAATARAIAELSRRGTYARDLLARDPGLRAVPEGGALPAGLALSGVRPEGASLVLSPGESALLYDPAGLDRDAAEMLALQLATLLASIAEAPERPLVEQAVVGDEERRRVEAANDTRVAYEARRVDELVFERAAALPEKTAVVFRDRRLSYRELAVRAEGVANALVSRGVAHETLVAVFLPRAPELVVGLLGVMRAGGAYVPLDPSYPTERLARTLEATSAPFVLTTRALAPSLPPHGGEVVLIDEIGEAGEEPEARPRASAEALAYVLFTSGSTGRPKGVMVTHRNLSNLFAGLDRLLGGETPGVFLALTSVAFDISALELFWTLARGFTVVLQEEDRLGARERRAAPARPLDFSLFYFAAEAVGERGPRYRLLLEGARFADAHGFRAVWTPERHFHSFGGLYPNPSVTGAALAAATSRVGIRAGSVVLPLHDPIRVAEEWSVVDNLSNGRAGVSFASGWHARDFALAPERYADRKDAMLRGIDVVRRLWRGESVPARSGDGGEISVALMPPPVQKELPFWLTAAGNVETFRAAGTLGANLLTNLLGQDAGELAAKIAAYREAWRVSGHRGEGVVTLMVHAFLGDDEARVKEAVRGPFSKYLAASFDLIKMAPTAFPAFRQPSRAGSGGFDPARVTDEDREALVAHAFSRYVEASGLFGTPRSCRDRAEALRETGVDEVACLVDFGVATDEVLAGLERLDALRAACASETAAEPLDFSLAAQVRRHGVTHAQVTPSLARLLLADPSARAALARLSVLLVGGEGLPLALARELAALVPGRVMNMYGPTETTVWSSAAELERPVESVTLGCPIANTRLEVLDATLEPAPVGVVGELAIGGDGLARGYLDDPDTTATRFVEHPELGRLYRTGDLASRRPDGSVLFHGRADDQVKLAGHRVELGEIEAVLLGVPGVGAAAAAVREDDSGSPRLVAYLVPKSAAAAHDATSRWRAVWDETYRTRSGGAGPLLSGWRSAVTDAPIPLAEMEEWIETTVARVRALLRGSVRRVLEIGCGAGLLLERLAPECEVYEATDVSEEALAIVRERLALAGVPIPSVRLARRPAHDFASVARGAFDLVILNSVAQYFPDSEYLVRVLSGAAAALAPGGAVFLGDVKSLPHQRLLAFEAELARAPASLEAARLAERAAAREARGAELALDPAFLGALPRRLPGLVGATALLKRGRAANELTRYRYDVVLRFGGARPDAPLAQAVRSPERADAHAIARLLGDAPAALCVTDIPNPRHAREILAAELAAKGSGTAGDVRAAAAELPRAGVGPEDLLALDVPYDVTLAFAASGAPDRYDALFRRRDGRGAGESLEPLPLPPESKPLQSCASRPSSGDGLEAAALAALRERLPAPLVPSAVVVLPRLPLTPNGKLDRKALPAPEPRREDTAAGAPPEGEVEERIAAVWRDLLGVSEVARDVNFFDLGANSLLMLEATGRLAAALSRETSLVEMFRFPSVKALAEHFGRSDAQNDGDEAGAVAKSQARGERRREARERRASATPTAASTEVRA